MHAVKISCKHDWLATSLYNEADWCNTQMSFLSPINGDKMNETREKGTAGSSAAGTW